jgi:hypothetical protein
MTGSQKGGMLCNIELMVARVERQLFERDSL